MSGQTPVKLHKGAVIHEPGKALWGCGNAAGGGEAHPKLQLELAELHGLGTGQGCGHPNFPTDHGDTGMLWRMGEAEPQVGKNPPGGAPGWRQRRLPSFCPAGRPRGHPWNPSDEAVPPAHGRILSCSGHSCRCFLTHWYHPKINQSINQSMPQLLPSSEGLSSSLQGVGQ